MASDRPTGGAHGWLKSAVGRATGSELRTRKSLIRLDFIEQKSERSVMPQDTGVGRNVVLDGLDFASLRRVWEQTFGATWNGRTYQVEILDSGYRFDGKTPIRPSRPSQSESPEPTGPDHAFSV